MAGWISLHRKIIDNPIYSNAFMLKLWIHCLMKATHTEHNQLVGNQMVKLEKGQFVTGRNSLFEEYNRGAKKDEVISDRTLWRWLKNFEEWQMLSIKSTTKYSVVTVVNWNEHQQHDQRVSNSRPASVQQMTNECPSDDQQVSTNNNVNNVNNDNKDTNIKPSRQKRVFDKDSDEMKLVEFFVQEIRKNSSDFKTPNLQNWCDEMRKIIELDKRDKSEVSKLIRWVQSDDFEKANVLSPTKLRKRYDALKIKMLTPTKKKESREKVPNWFGKKDDEAAAKTKAVVMDIEEERKRLRQELLGG